MNKLDFKKILPYVWGALCVVFGILIVAMPAFWVKFFVVIFGLGAIAYGIYEFVQLKNISSEAQKYKTSLIIKACVSLVFGILSVIVPIAIANTAWKIVVYLFAAGLVIVSALGFYSVSVLQETSPKRKQYIVENLVLLVVAILLFLISPEKLGATIIRIAGICAIVVGLIWITLAALGKTSTSKDIVVEAETVEVKDSTEETEKLDDATTAETEE